MKCNRQGCGNQATHGFVCGGCGATWFKCNSASCNINGCNCKVAPTVTVLVPTKPPSTPLISFMASTAPFAFKAPPPVPTPIASSSPAVAVATAPAPFAPAPPTTGRAPLTVAQILAARTDRIQTWQAHVAKPPSLSASLTDGQGQTTSLNVAPAPAVFTVISWNVQVLNPGKSEANPFVNKVINRVLEAVSADVAILLETREDAYINLNAIEHKIARDETWTDPDASVFSFLDEPAITDLPHTLGELESLAGEDLTYLQAASEMTGKHYKPPATIYLHHAGFALQQQIIADVKMEKKLALELEAIGQHNAAVAQKNLLIPQKSKHLKPKKVTTTQAETLAKIVKKNKKAADKHPLLVAAALKATPALQAAATEYLYFPKLLVAHCANPDGSRNGVWKKVVVADQAKPLRDYYEIGYHDLKGDFTLFASPKELLDFDVAHDARVAFKLKRCAACKKSYGYGEGSCATCNQFSHYSLGLKYIEELLSQIAFSPFFRPPQMESYAVLYKPSLAVFGPSSNGVFCADKQAVVHPMSAALVMRAPPEVTSTKPGVAPVIAFRYGELLGYQTKAKKNEIGFYGRCPYVLPVEIVPPGATTSISLPIVAFHGPYGKDTLDGIKARAEAMREMLKADVGAVARDASGAPVTTSSGGLQTVPLKDSPFAMVMGDFNLDYDPGLNFGHSANVIANTLYSELATGGFKPMIGEGVATSLRVIETRKDVWREDWPKFGAATAEYTSSAYDNFFLRGDKLLPFVANAGAIDVLTIIADAIGDYDLPADDPRHDDFQALTPKQKAFVIYRRYVSDHLPILCDILVEPMNAGLVARLKAQAKARIMKSITRPALSVILDHQGVLSFDAFSGNASTDVYEPRYDAKEVRTARLTGTIVAQQDSHLIVKSTISTNQIILWSFQPPGGVVRVKKLLALGDFQPGKRIEAELLDPKPS